MQKVKIVREPSADFPFAVIYKPQGLPSAPLKGRTGEDAFSFAADIFTELKKVHGKNEIECGLLHRIDTDTQGLLMAAATQEAYDFMCSAQKEGKFVKTYRANCIFNPDNAKTLGGFPPGFDLFGGYKQKDADVNSFFRNYGIGQKEVRPVTEYSSDSALKKIGVKKMYTTHFMLISKDGKSTEFLCRITQGYRHQVRCHCAWCGFPIIGDKIYNAADRFAEKTMQFVAVKLEFPNPVTGITEKIEL